MAAGRQERALATVGDWFRTFNRARKARWMHGYLRRHDVASVLVVGAGGEERPWENAVERSITTRASFAVWSGIDENRSLPNYVVCDARHLPFRTAAFDLVFSNAVIEHVGHEQEQASFVGEHQRVGLRWALTTPNRWFPVESHTFTLVRHWSARWRADCNEFTRLLSRRELRRLLPRRAHVHGSILAATFTAHAD